MKDKAEFEIKKDVSLSDLTCGFSHDGTCCPIAVSVLHESTWLCSRHFRHLRRGQSLEAISFLYEAISDVRKFTTHAKKQEHWFEEELRNYNLDSKLWAEQMPKPMRFGDSQRPSVNAAGELVEKKIAALANDVLPTPEEKRQVVPGKANKIESWDDLGW